MVYKNESVAIAGTVIRWGLSKEVGIEFGEMESDQRSILEGWLAETD
jgi:hypothetical protein